jgi:hypothetical protein
MQRARNRAGRKRCIGSPCLSQGELRIEMRPGPDGVFPERDPVETGPDNGRCGQPSRGNFGPGLRRSQTMKFSHSAPLLEPDFAHYGPIAPTYTLFPFLPDFHAPCRATFSQGHRTYDHLTGFSVSTYSCPTVEQEGSFVDRSSRLLIEI